jgi:hypothetical protein
MVTATKRGAIQSKKIHLRRSTSRTYGSTRGRTTWGRIPRRRTAWRRTTNAYTSSPNHTRRKKRQLVGNTPLIFTGDHTRAEEFITQWQLTKESTSPMI